MARRSDHTKDELRAMILDAALALIDEEGVAALSTRRIAQRIGYTSGTLYQHFKDVGDIVLQVNARTLGGLIEVMEAAKPGLPAEPSARIHRYADIYLDYLRRNRNAWDAMFAWRRQEGDAVPEWYKAQIEKLVGMVATAIGELHAGPGRGVSDPREVARMMWASVHGICALQSGGRLELIMKSPVERLVHQLIDVHICAYTGVASYHQVTG